MALSQLISFLSEAGRLAKMDPDTAFPGETVTPDQVGCHRLLVRAGKIGAGLGAVFGAWMGYELYLHPDSASPDGRQVMMVFVLAPLMMVVVGILCGLSWAGLFLPGAFYNGPVGAHWMKLAGTKRPGSTRLVVAIVALLTTGWIVFFPICVWLGKV